MNRYLILIIFLLVNTKIYGQSVDASLIDSLKRSLALEEDIQTYYALSVAYSSVDSTQALEAVDRGIELATRQDEFYLIAQGQFNKGGLLLDYNDPVQAEAMYRSADSILSEIIKTDSSEVNLRLWIRSNFNIGVAKSFQGIYEDLYYLEKIRPVAEKIGFNRILAISQTNLGINFFNNKQFDKAYKYFKDNEKNYLLPEEYLYYLDDRFVFAACLIDMDSLEVARGILSDIKVIVDTIDNKTKLQLYHNILGQYYEAKNDLESAIANFKIAERLLESNQISRYDLQLNMDMMQTYGRQKDYNNAIKYARKGIQSARETNNKVIESEFLKELSKYLSGQNRVSEAYETLAKHVMIADSLHFRELDLEVNRLESQYQSEKKEREILQLKTENDSVALELAQKQSQNYFLLLISLGLFLLAGVAFQGYRNFKRKDRLKEAEIKELKFEQEAKIYNAMLSGQEDERKRLAIDLHDGLAGRLSATRIKLEKLAQQSNDEASEKGVMEAVDHIDDSLVELRSIAMNLMPETLFRYGLKNAVEDYCSSISQGLDNIKFIIQFYDSDVGLSDNTNLTIYRIIQELINNAVKHSNASEVLIQYLVDGNKINITVEDNGQGFDMKAVKQKGRMGLDNLKTRVAYLNGEIDFYSSPEDGTTTHIVIDT